MGSIMILFDYVVDCVDSLLDVGILIVPKVCTSFIFLGARADQVFQIVCYTTVVGNQYSLHSFPPLNDQSLLVQAIPTIWVKDLSHFLAISLFKLNLVLAYQKQFSLQQFFPAILSNKLLSISIRLIVLDLFDELCKGLIPFTLLVFRTKQVQEFEFWGENALGNQMGVKSPIVWKLIDFYKPGYIRSKMTVDIIERSLLLFQFAEERHHLIVFVGEDGRRIFLEGGKRQQAIIDLQWRFSRFVGQNYMAVSFDAKFLSNAFDDFSPQPRTCTPSQAPQNIDSHRTVGIFQFSADPLDNILCYGSIFFEIFVQSGWLNVAELFDSFKFIGMKGLLGQMVKIAIRPVVSTAVLEIFDVGGIKPFRLTICDLLDYFWLCIDHDSVDSVGRPEPSAVIKG